MRPSTPLMSGKPEPDGKNDIGDVVILRKAVGCFLMRKRQVYLSVKFRLKTRTDRGKPMMKIRIINVIAILLLVTACGGGGALSLG
jgi:hypothetical protein